LWVIGGVYEPLRNSHKRNVHNIPDADCNIHAGSKMLHSIQQNYFNDPALDLTNKTLLTFAAYNAGPARISRVRRRAKEEGLDPTSGSAMLSWLWPKPSDKRPFNLTPANQQPLNEFIERLAALRVSAIRNSNPQFVFTQSCGVRSQQVYA
jgi:hypothetical protein